VDIFMQPNDVLAIEAKPRGRSREEMAVSLSQRTPPPPPPQADAPSPPTTGRHSSTSRSCASEQVKAPGLLSPTPFEFEMCFVGTSGV
jgi:hypothetical protein